MLARFSQKLLMQLYSKIVIKLLILGRAHSIHFVKKTASLTDRFKTDKVLNKQSMLSMLWLKCINFYKMESKIFTKLLSKYASLTNTTLLIAFNTQIDNTGFKYLHYCSHPWMYLEKQFVTFKNIHFIHIFVTLIRWSHKDNECLKFK